MVADAFSRKSMGSLAYIVDERRPMAMDIQGLSNQGVRIDHKLPGRLIAGMVVQSSLVGEVKTYQYNDPQLARLRDRVQNRGVKSFAIDGDGILRRNGRLCIPMVGNVKQLILEEAHSSRKSIHPGAMKMYQNLRELYWWKEWKWERITMDFVIELPNTFKKHDSVWVIVDRLTKSAHFIPVRVTHTAKQLGDIYLRFGFIGCIFQ
ncbi:hypothetical protein MTR67_048307 [Solanum verrucosum]|uniref:Integrase zinc-binding domain-containing protein n=1 Tax=Solanum verrucosum TaxID=315347 RepID=A0AAF0UY74_SOLVR|nr:hypothetical protein MTR67_048307 [Solanum verrucosum]